MSCPGEDPAPGILEQLENTILGDSPRFTRLEVADRAGVPIDVASQLWRALGFASPGDDELVFNEADVRALQLLSAFVEIGAIDGGNIASLARSVGQSFARLAEWQTDVLSQVVERSGDNPADVGSMVLLADDLLPLMEQLHSYVWRRHLATSVTRALARPAQEEAAPALVVGLP